MSENRVQITIVADGRNAAEVINHLNAQLSGTETQASKAGKGMRDLGQATKNTADEFGSLGAIVKTAMGYFAVGKIVQYGKAILDAGVALDSLNRSYAAITGSQTQATETFSWLRQEAARLGQDFYALAPAFKSVSAAAKGTVMEGDMVRKAFLGIVEASTAMGLSTETSSRAFLQLTQMISKQKVEYEDLKIMAESFPGAIEVFSQAIGKSVPVMLDMMSKGQVLTKDVLPGLYVALNNAYGAASNTAGLEAAQSAINRMSEEWSDLKNNLYNSDAAIGSIKAVTAALEGLNDLLESGAFKDVFTQDGFATGPLAATGPFGFMAEVFLRYQKAGTSASETVKKSFLDTWGTIERTGTASANNFLKTQAEAIISADREFEKLSETKRQKLDKQYNDLKGKVSDSAALERWYHEEVRKLDEAETNKREAEYKKQTAELEKEIKKRNELYAKQADNTKNTEIIYLESKKKFAERAIEVENERIEAQIKKEEEFHENIKRAREEAAKQQEEENKRMLERIQDATADIFYDLFSNIGDGWSNLWNNMKNWALRILSELAAKAAMTQIIVPIMTTVTGAGTANAAVQALSGNGTGSLFGNIPTGSMLNNIPGLSSISSLLATQLPGTTVLSGGALSLAGGGTAGGSIASLAAAENLAGLTGGMSIGTALSLGGLGGLGYSLLGGALGLPQNQWSGITSSLGGALGAWGGGALGSTLGGTIGSALPGVGTVVGAVLGGLASKLFGDKKQSSPKVGYGNYTVGWDDLSTQITSYTGHGAKDKNAAVFDDSLKQIIEAAQGQVEGVLGAFGQQYVDMLSGTSVNYGRKSAGATWGWEFKLDKGDKYIQEQMAKASKELQAKIFAAAAPAMSKAGSDYLGSGDVTSAYSIMADGQGKFAEIVKIIQEGVKDGDLQTYATQLQAFQTAIKTVNATWGQISQASAELVTPLTEAEQQQRAINAQYDAWIATLKDLGIATKELNQIEADRATLLERVAATVSLSIRSTQAELSGKSDQFAMSEIAGRYGWGSTYWSNGQINRGNVQRDALDWFKSASVADVQAAAKGHGVTVDQLLEDMRTIDAYMKATAVVTQTATTETARALERISTVVDNTADEFARLTRSLIEYRQELLSSEAGGGTIAEQYAYARAIFERTASQAVAGDQTALGNLQGVSSAYLSAARGYNSTAQGYRADAAAVLSVLDMAAATGATKSGQSLQELKAEVQALREESKAANFQLAKVLNKVATIWQRWDVEGTPEVRA